MRSLRSKLFIHVGFILLFVAVLNDLLPEFQIRRKINQVSTYLDSHISALEERLRTFTSFFVMYNLVQSAVDLDGTTTLIATNMTDFVGASPWAIASQVASYNTQIAFLRVQNGAHQDIKLLVKDAPLYIPSFQTDEDRVLWVKIEGKPLYLAIPSEGNTFFLFPADLSLVSEDAINKLPDPFSSKLRLAKQTPKAPPNNQWQVAQEKTPPFSEELNAEEIWRFLFWSESQWLERVHLIHKLCLWHEKNYPVALAGVLSLDSATHEGAVLLTQDLLLMQPGGPDLPLDTLQIALLNYEKEPDLQILKKIELVTDQQEVVTVGFSVSSMVKKIALLSHKPVVLTWEGPPLGFTGNGEYFDPVHEGFPFQQAEREGISFVSWRGSRYAPHEIVLKNVHLLILTPEAEALATTSFLNRLKTEFSLTLTLSLLGATLISFGLALALLHRMSRRVTAPIALLSHAAEELGHGNPTEVHLPHIKSDTQEVHLLIESFKEMLGALKDRDKIRGVLNKVVSKEISEQLLSHDIELGGEKKEVTILFADIRNFTHTSEYLDPQKLIRLLNSYLTQMCHVIDKTKGVVDKFVGDEIMALYGAPLPMEAHPLHALTAATLMLEELRAWNQKRGQGEPHFEIGIGIHTGVVCAGNMGGDNRQNYTVIGSNVNLAARLCSFAKPMQIVISEETCHFPRVKDEFEIHPLEPAKLKGFDHPVPLYEVTGRLKK